MEKVKILSAIDTSRKTKTGSPIINVTLEDGRKGGCFKADILQHIGKEIDLEIKEGTEYQGVKQYIFNMPSENAGKFGFKKDYTTDKKIAALKCAVDSAKFITDSDIKALMPTDMVLKIADKYFEYLNK